MRSAASSGGERTGWAWLSMALMDVDPRRFRGRERVRPPFAREDGRAEEEDSEQRETRGNGHAEKVARLIRR